MRPASTPGVTEMRESWTSGQLVEGSSPDLEEVEEGGGAGATGQPFQTGSVF